MTQIRRRTYMMLPSIFRHKNTLMRSGFSLVELMLYAAILSVILIVVTNIFLSIVDLQLESQSTSGLAQDGRYVLSRFNYDLRRASVINSPTLGGSSSTLTVTIDGVPYLYLINTDSNLGLTIGSSPEVIMNSYGTKVSDLMFTHLGNGTGEEDLVRIKYTVTSRTIRQEGVESRTYESTVGLRT